MSQDDRRPDEGISTSRSVDRIPAAQVCRFLIAERKLIAKLFDRKAFPNPRWDVVLDLFLAQLEGKQVYQSWLAPDAPPSNAHRHSSRLEALGIIVRTPDPNDHRRVMVELKPDVIDAIDEILDGLARQWQSIL